VLDVEKPPLYHIPLPKSVLATYLFLLFLSGILQYSYAKGYGRFLEQPPKKLDNPLSITI
jgi:hypothetical protein